MTLAPPARPRIGTEPPCRIGQLRVVLGATSAGRSKPADAGPRHVTRSLALSPAREPTRIPTGTRSTPAGTQSRGHDVLLVDELTHQWCEAGRRRRAGWVKARHDGADPSRVDSHRDVCSNHHDRTGTP